MSVSLEGTGTRRELLARAGGILAALAVGESLAGCGANIGAGASASSLQPFNAAGFLLDISGSTRSARLGGEYLSTVQEIALDVALRGSGKLYLTFIGGEVYGRERVYQATVSPEHPENSRKREPEARAKVANTVASVERSLKTPPEREYGSAIVETIAFLMKRAPLGQGDAIALLSDCYQFSPRYSFDRDDISPAGVQRALDYFETLNMIPDLHGMTLRAPFIMGGGPYHLSVKRRVESENFWVAYAERTGARLDRSAPSSS